MYCASGQRYPGAAYGLPGDDNELDKRLTASLLAGHSIILIDNVDRLLDSSVLSAALTAFPAYRGRLLGKTEMLLLPNLALWMVTGNNLALSLEIAGRSLTIRQDARVAHPGRRTDFRHPQLLTWVRENRARLVGALVSLVGEWVEAGMPACKASGAVLGGFEAYVQAIGGILEFHKIDGFLADQDRRDRGAERATDEWVAFVGRWWATWADVPITAGQALAVAKGGDDGTAPILLGIWAGRAGHAAAMRVGHALRRQCDRRFGDFFIRDAGQGSTGGNAYRLEPLPCESDVGGTSDSPVATAAEARDKAPKGPEAPGSRPPTQGGEFGQDPGDATAPLELWGKTAPKVPKLLAKLRTQGDGELEQDSYSSPGASGPLGALHPRPAAADATVSDAPGPETAGSGPWEDEL
ncbi:MAG: hypothetical protein ACREN1_07110 [Candidatus Dormibacteria bacterium]